VTVGDGAKLVELAGIAEHVDRDDATGAFGHRGFDSGRIHIQGHRIDVGEHGSGPFDDETVRGGYERQR
jgi:hypothetical protein